MAKKRTTNGTRTRAQRRAAQIALWRRLDRLAIARAILERLPRAERDEAKVAYYDWLHSHGLPSLLREGEQSRTKGKPLEIPLGLAALLDYAPKAVPAMAPKQPTPTQAKVGSEEDLGALQKEAEWWRSQVEEAAVLERAVHSAMGGPLHQLTAKAAKGDIAAMRQTYTTYGKVESGDYWWGLWLGAELANLKMIDAIRELLAGPALLTLNAVGQAPTVPGTVLREAQSQQEQTLVAALLAAGFRAPESYKTKATLWLGLWLAKHRAKVR